MIFKSYKQPKPQSTNIKTKIGPKNTRFPTSVYIRCSLNALASAHRQKGKWSRGGVRRLRGPGARRVHNSAQVPILDHDRLNGEQEEQKTTPLISVPPHRSIFDRAEAQIQPAPGCTVCSGCIWLSVLGVWRILIWSVFGYVIFFG